MDLYSNNEYYKLYKGNMLDLGEVIEPCSIDAVLTDPPYELNFMGKGWDNSGIAFQPDTWKRCLDALKPGGYLLAFGGSRTYHRIACAIEDAGFEIRDCIMWLYGSGFPKSMDISKQIDKKGGNDYSKEFAIDLRKARESRGLTMSECDKKYCGGTTNWSWYEGRPAGVRVPDYDTYLKIVSDFTELEKYRELIKEAEREVIGKKESGCFNNQETDRYTIGSSKALEVDITAPSTELAKQRAGWGTALKPSYEPIIVARKPLEGSCTDNVIKYGVGGINIDECRIGLNGEKPPTGSGNKSEYASSWTLNGNGGNITSDLGRFPANTILTYGDDDKEEVCGGFPNTKSTYNKDSKHGTEIHRENADTLKYGYKTRIDSSSYNDEGSAARYFYNAKASKRDRDEGLQEFETKSHAEINNRKEGSAGAERAYGGGTNPYLSVSSPRKNVHPCVKPTDLMQYLVRLVTPNGGTVLDPFNGSGSTGKAVMYENKDRNKNYKYIGIELTEEYLPIAKARIEYVINKGIEKEKSDPKQEEQTKQRKESALF